MAQQQAPRAPGAALPERYRVSRMLGSSPAGAVYLCDDLHLHCTAAVRVLADDRGDPAWLAERLTAVHARLTELDHPVLAAAYDVGRTPDGAVYLAMDHLPIGSIAEHGQASLQTVLRWAIELLHGLALAHKRGFAHGAIGPDNVLLEPGEDGKLHARIADFGIGLDKAELTGGSGLDIAKRRDLYCVSAVVLELVTDSPAVQWGNRAAHGPPLAGNEIRPRSGVVLPDALVDVLRSGLVGAGWASAEAFAEALEPFVAEPGQPSEPAAAVEEPVAAGDPDEPSTAEMAMPLGVEPLVPLSAELARNNDAAAVLRALPRMAARMVDVSAIEVIERGVHRRPVVVARAGPALDLRAEPVASAVERALATGAVEAVPEEGERRRVTIVPLPWNDQRAALVLQSNPGAELNEWEIGRLSVFGTMAGLAIERAKTRQGLLDETACRAATLELVQDAVVILARSGVVRAVTSKAAEMLDVHRQGVVGRPLRDLRGMAKLARVVAFNHSVDSEIVTLPGGPTQVKARPFPGGVVLRLEKLAAARQTRGTKLNKHRGFEDFVGTNPEVVAAVRRARAEAPADKAILLSGEPGTGRKMLAEAIHRGSLRSTAAFNTLNVGTLVKEHVEGLLFGFEKGAPGAGRQGGMPGKAELSDGGTLVIDQIDKLPLRLQTRIEELVVEHTITRVGGTEKRPVDVRVIAVTDKDLALLVREGTFSRGLWRALSGVHLQMPPLRERWSDIPVLLQHFVQFHGRILGRSEVTVAPAVIEDLRAYRWPGNVRELCKLVEAWMSLLPSDQQVIDRTPAHIRRALARR